LSLFALLSTPSKHEIFRERELRRASIHFTATSGSGVINSVTQVGLSEDYGRKPLDAGARYAERRSVPRYPFVANVEIYEPLGRIRLAGQTSEISANGCYVDVLNPLEKNTVLQLRILRDGQEFQTWARVAYTQPNLGMGVAFFDTLEEHRRIISDWLVELSLQPKPS
jgi:hypothetical protein